MLRLAVVILVLVSLPVTASGQWPLQFAAGPEWEIEYQGDKVDFFSLDRPKGENVFFTISRWPTRGGREQVPYYIHKMARSLEETFTGKPVSILLKGGYEIEDITGGEFSGQAAVFTMRDSTVQTIFMISDGDGIWNGQYSGSRAIWAEAKEVLGTLRRPISPPGDR